MEAVVLALRMTPGEKFMIYRVADFSGQSEKKERFLVKDLQLLVPGTIERTCDVTYFVLPALSSPIRMARHTTRAHTVGVALNHVSRHHSGSAWG